MNTYSLYNIASGAFIDKRFSGKSAAVVADMMDMHPNCAFILGEYDALCERVDLTTGTVVDYIPQQPGPRYQWDASAKRWLYVPSDAESLWFTKQDAMRQVNTFYAAVLSDVRSTYPDDEVTSWAKQETEARAWVANNAAPTPLLSAIATGRGVPFALLVTKVIDKADLFAARTGALIGARQRTEDQIAAAKTVSDVEILMLSYGNMR